MSGKLKPPTKELREVLKAAREQHDAAQAALVTSFDFDDRFQKTGDSTLKEVQRYLDDANSGLIATMNVYRRLVTYVKTVADLEGWEKER